MMRIRTTTALGEYIREVRKKQGLTQQALAGACGVGPRFIVELEKGKTTCELGKVLLVLQMLGIQLTVDTIGTAP